MEIVPAALSDAPDPVELAHPCPAFPHCRKEMQPRTASKTVSGVVVLASIMASARGRASRTLRSQRAVHEHHFVARAHLLRVSPEGHAGAARCLFGVGVRG